MVETLSADRAVVLSNRGESGYRDLKAWAAHGLSLQTLWENEPVSLKLFDRVYDSGKPLLLADAQNDLETSSFISVGLSGIRSVLCFPFFNSKREVTGLLYADSLVKVNSFKASHFKAIKNYIQAMEQRLHLMEAGEYSKAEKLQIQIAVAVKPKSKHSQASAPSQPEKSESTPPSKAPSGKPDFNSSAYFFKCLATTTGAGITLDRGVLLAAPFGDLAFREVADFLSNSLRGGVPLSHAMSLCPKAFSDFQVSMVKVGENTGSLHEILQGLANYEETKLKRWQELKSALTYPLCILAVCTLLLFLAPPYLLNGQRALLNATGNELPAISKFVFGLSDFISGPGLMPILASVAAIVYGLKSTWNHPVWRRRRWNVFLYSPVIGPLLQTFSVTRFSHALTLQLGSGVLLTKALPVAGATTGVPKLEDLSAQAVEQMLAGSSLSESLAATEFFPPVFMGLLRAGEESGAVATSLESATRLTEAELEAAYRRFATLLQPLVMLVMGVLVGFLMVATMLPMVQALNSL